MGEAVFWKDSEILHGRSGFKPKMESERFLWKAAIEIGGKKKFEKKVIVRKNKVQIG